MCTIGGLQKKGGWCSSAPLDPPGPSPASTGVHHLSFPVHQTLPVHKGKHMCPNRQQQSTMHPNLPLHWFATHSMIAPFDHWMPVVILRLCLCFRPRAYVFADCPLIDYQWAVPKCSECPPPLVQRPLMRPTPYGQHLDCQFISMWSALMEFRIEAWQLLPTLMDAYRPMDSHWADYQGR